jgi:hypothetical protein
VFYGRNRPGQKPPGHRARRDGGRAGALNVRFHQTAGARAPARQGQTRRRPRRRMLRGVRARPT